MINDLLSLNQYWQDAATSHAAINQYLYGDTGPELMTRINKHFESDFDGSVLILEVSQTKLSLKDMSSIKQAWYCSVAIVGRYDIDEPTSLISTRQSLNTAMLELLGGFISQVESQESNPANRCWFKIDDEMFPIGRITNTPTVGWRIDFDLIEYVNEKMF